MFFTSLAIQLCHRYRRKIANPVPLLSRLALVCVSCVHLSYVGLCNYTGRETLDFAGWQRREPHRAQDNEENDVTAAPFTVVFGGNGVGKSAVFDAILFVLGQVRNHIV